MTPPLFLVDAEALAADQVAVSGDEGRHAADVRRLRAGERVLLGDGNGTVADAIVVTVGKGTFSVDVVDRRVEAEPSPRYVVAQALAKGGRDEDAVEAMTEVGVDEVVAWQAARSVARWSERTDARWQATARAAAKQARRAWVPRVSGPVTTATLTAHVVDAALAVVLHEDADEPLADVPLPDHGDVLLVVGPEGGVAPEELSVLVEAGARCCRLGSSVLRTSTAGVAALSVLSAAARWR